MNLPSLTQEVVGGNDVGVPHLHSERGARPKLLLFGREHVFLAFHYDHLLCFQVLEREYEPPVEIPLATQGPRNTDVKQLSKAVLLA